MIRRILAPTTLGPALPFTFMTNGGIETEQSKCDKLNKMFELTDQEPHLTKENINLCHTVFGSEQIQNVYSEKIVLVESSCKD